MAKKKDYLKDPERYSVDELVQAIQSGVVTLIELQQTGLLSISKRYTINERLGMNRSRQVSNFPVQSSSNSPVSSNPSVPSKSYSAQGTDYSSRVNGGSNDGFWGAQETPYVPVSSKRRKKSSFEWKYILIPALVIVVGGLVGLAVMLLGDRKMKPEEIYSRYKKSVVLIAMQYHFKATVDGEDLSDILDDPDFDVMSWYNGKIIWNQPSIGTGTGFFVSDDGKIVTCNHVVSDYENYKDSIEFRLRDAFRNKQNEINTYAALAAMFGVDATTNKWSYLADHLKVERVVDFVRIAMNDTRIQSLDDMLPCSIIKTSKDADVDAAVIQLNSKKTPAEVVYFVDIPGSMKSDNTSKVKFVMGNDVYSIGFPLSLAVGQTNIGIEATNQHGTITQECGEYTYGHDINIHHGASGSPVFDNHGRFAGIVNAGFMINGSAQGYNKAVKPEHVARLLNY